MKIFQKTFAVAALGYLFAANIAGAASTGPLFEIWKGTGGSGQTCNIAPGGCSLCDGLQVAVNIVNDLTAAAVIVTVGMIIYGAIRMMISGGSEEMFKNAKGVITSAVIGFIIVLCGWLIVNTLIHIVSGHPDFPWTHVQCTK